MVILCGGDQDESKWEKNSWWFFSPTILEYNYLNLGERPHILKGKETTQLEFKFYFKL